MASELRARMCARPDTALGSVCSGKSVDSAHATSVKQSDCSGWEDFSAPVEGKGAEQQAIKPRSPFLDRARIGSSRVLREGRGRAEQMR